VFVEYDIKVDVQEDDSVRITASAPGLPDIVEQSDPNGGWYAVVGSAAVVDAAARAVQRLIWRRDGESEKEMWRDPHSGLTVLSQEAIDNAQLWVRSIGQRVADGCGDSLRTCWEIAAADRADRLWLESDMTMFKEPDKNKD